MLLSADKSPAEFQKHLKDKQMQWLAVPIERNSGSKSILARLTSFIEPKRRGSLKITDAPEDM